MDTFRLSSLCSCFCCIQLVDILTNQLDTAKVLTLYIKTCMHTIHIFTTYQSVSWSTSVAPSWC